MNDQNNQDNPTARNDESGRTPPPKEGENGLVARLKALYKERPATFALGMMGISAAAFLLGTLLTGRELFIFGPPLHNPMVP